MPDMNPTSKAVVLILAVSSPNAASAAQANAASAAQAQASGCPQILQNIQTFQTNFGTTSGSYWTHQKNFVSYVYGPGHALANWQQLAAAEKSLAAALQQGVSATLAAVLAVLTTAKSQGCLPSAQLQVIQEQLTGLGRRINFDQFPTDESAQATGPGTHLGP
jgi:hypothetical protein